MPDIPGLAYISDFITRDEESTLITNIDNQPWLNDLKRRVQHYGYNDEADIACGLKREYKHEDNPTKDKFAIEIERAVMLALDEIIDFERG